MSGRRTIEDRARDWLSGKIVSHRGCIEWLSATQDNAVNIEAPSDTVRRMTREVEIWEHLLSLLPGAPPSPEVSP